jgi:hypothetical protein
VERLELVKYVFRDSRGFPLSPVFAPGSKLKAVGLPDVNHAIGRSDGALQFLEDCDKAIDEMTDPPHDTPVDRFKKKASRFFYNFDLHTSPVLWGYLEADKVAQAAWPGWNPQLVPDRGTVANAINHAMAYLTERVKDRVKKADVPAFPEFDKATQIYQDTKLLSELQLKLCSRVHGGLTAAQLRNAFSWFANGELRLPLPGLGIAVQPSCGYYFFFGEFALMAMDNSIAKRRWTSLARTLVRTQLVFAPSYAPSGGDGRTLEFGSYSSENFDGPKGDKDALRGEFNRLGAVGIASRASSNAKKHLGGIA